MPLYRPRYVSRVKTHRVFPRKKRVTFARKVKKIVTRTKEPKMLLSQADWTDLEAASQIIVNLSGMAAGDSAVTRDGDVIEALAIRGRIAFRATATTSASTSQIRVQVVKCRQCDGTLPTLADILPAANASLDRLCSDIPNANTGLQQSKRKFQVIYDRFLTLPYDSAVALGNLKVLKVNIKLHGKVYYSSTGSGDEGNNQYVLMVHTNAADDKIESTYHLRFHFKDV